MISNRLALVVLGVACVTAAGGGGLSGHRPRRLEHRGGGAAPLRHARTSAPARPQPSRKPRPSSATSQPADGRPRRGRPTERPRQRARLRPRPARTAPAPTRPAARRDPHRRGPPAARRSRAKLAEQRRRRQQPRRHRLPVEKSRTGRDRRVRPEPPPPAFEELVVSADSVIGLQLDTIVSAASAHASRTASKRGSCATSGRAARWRFRPARARSDRSRSSSAAASSRNARASASASTRSCWPTARGCRSRTETIYRYGDAPANGSAAKIGGGAVAGAILGAIVGGAKGAAIGATAGARRAERLR